MLQRDLKNQEGTVQKLNQAVDSHMTRTGKKSGPMIDKQQEMNELYHTVQILARDRQNELQDTLKEVRIIT